MCELCSEGYRVAAAAVWPEYMAANGIDGIDIEVQSL